ncbi:MAG: CoA pyrophosphatase [Pseudomonadales bacterium]|nr:CoA pyrophosphatase [Pseudomonadales bacterium]
MTARRGTDWRDQLVRRFKDSTPLHDVSQWCLSGMSAEHSQRFIRHFPAQPVHAAVLVPLIERPQGMQVLLTVRAAGLKNHAAQVSFPGGRVDPADEGPRGAALREAQEEIGLAPDLVEVIGYLPDHLVVSGYRVTPVLGLVNPAHSLVLNPHEVVATFEVPVDHVFDPVNHQARKRRFDNGDEVDIYDIPFGEHHIWGATAGMLLTLCRLVQPPVVNDK